MQFDLNGSEEMVLLPLNLKTDDDDTANEERDEFDVVPFSIREQERREKDDVTGEWSKTGEKYLACPSTFAKAEVNAGLSRIQAEITEKCAMAGVDPDTIIPDFLRDAIMNTVPSRAGRAGSCFDQAALQKAIDQAFATKPRSNYVSLATYAEAGYNLYSRAGQIWPLSKQQVIDLVRSGRITFPVPVPAAKKRKSRKTTSASDAIQTPELEVEIGESMISDDTTVFSAVKHPENRVVETIAPPAPKRRKASANA